ncbi:hypothetical protein V6767_04130 [Martelella sp. FLE1502]
MDFLQTTYEAAAALGGWDRDGLECQPGQKGQPRPHEAARTVSTAAAARWSGRMQDRKGVT